MALSTDGTIGLFVQTVVEENDRLRKELAEAKSDLDEYAYGERRVIRQRDFVILVLMSKLGLDRVEIPTGLQSAQWGGMQVNVVGDQLNDDLRIIVARSYPEQPNGAVFEIAVTEVRQAEAA